MCNKVNKGKVKNTSWIFILPEVLKKGALTTKNYTDKNTNCPPENLRR